MIPHLLRCQGLAVKYYGFTLGRLGAGASSAFATTGFTGQEHKNEITDRGSGTKGAKVYGKGIPLRTRRPASYVGNLGYEGRKFSVGRDPFHGRHQR